jgi:hypothetical protein
MTMTPLTGTIEDGRVVTDGKIDWPDGTKVNITPQTASPGKIGLNPSEWRDDDDSLADWETWIASFEPVQFTPQEEAEMARFREAMRRFNIEAVRRQMEEGHG